MEYILTAMADHEGGSPILHIPAGSRKEALEKIGATESYVGGALTFSERTPKSVASNKELEGADWCELVEVESLSA